MILNNLRSGFFAKDVVPKNIHTSYMGGAFRLDPLPPGISIPGGAPQTPTPGISVIFQLGKAPPWKNSQVKNALRSHAKINCYCDKERKKSYNSCLKYTWSFENRISKNINSFYYLAI